MLEAALYLLFQAAPLEPSQVPTVAEPVVALEEGWSTVTGEEPGAGSAGAAVAPTDPWAAQPGGGPTVWYRRTVTLPPGAAAGGWALLVDGPFGGRYRVLADGEPVGGAGSVDLPLPLPRPRSFELPARATADGRVTVTVAFTPPGWTVPAILAGSAPFRGVWVGPRGRVEEVVELRLLRRAREHLVYLLFGFGFGLAGLVHLHLHQRRRSQRAYLWFGLGSTLLALNAVAFSAWTAPLFEGIAWPYRLMDASGHLAAASMTAFLWAILDRPMERVLRAYVGSHVAMGAFVLMAPFRWVLLTQPARFLWLLPILLAGLWVLVGAARRGHPDARTLVVGGLLLAAGEVGELLRTLGLPLPPSLPYLGFSALLVSMIVALGNRFARVQRELDDLRANLEEKVRERTEQLEEMSERAEAANRAKSRFLATMSHELRTPLNSVIGFSNLLLRKAAASLAPRHQDFVRRIRENGVHLLAIIDDILDLAKIEAEQMELSVTETRLEVLVASTLADLEGVSRGRDVELRSVVPSGLAPLETDAMRLRQVLINLVGNALKFTEEGAVEVRVLAQGGRATAIEVADSGGGIPPDRLADVFEPFEQVTDGPTSRSHQGSGLGLTISRTLCERMGYRLSLESRLGVGTTARISLTPTLPVEAGPMPEAPAEDGRRSLVLVIEDDPDARVLLAEAVQEHGCRVATAATGREGLRLARALRPDLVTLDLRLPDVHGWRVLREIKDDPELRRIPVVVVSVAAMEWRETFVGEVDLLQKPVDETTLRRVLDRHLTNGRGRALVVDDDGDARLLLHDLLDSSEGVSEVRMARDGMDGLKVLEDFTPDLVLLDLVMPRMNGFEFLRIFRGSPRFTRVPVVVVTSRELTPVELEVLEESSQAVVRKRGREELRKALGDQLGPYLTSMS